MTINHNQRPGQQAEAELVGKPQVLNHSHLHHEQSGSVQLTLHDGFVPPGSVNFPHFLEGIRPRGTQWNIV